jgi:protein SCO1
MKHTAGLFLIRADGRLQGMLDMHEPRETQLEKLKRLSQS